MPEPELYEAIVIGGGPAGLSAATWLARYRRRVLLIDAENPRNAPTWAVHGYLGLEDIPPEELRKIGREQAKRAGAEYECAVVETVEGERDHFQVNLADGAVRRARRLLFTTGLRDIIPEIPGMQRFYGSNIWHCPDCDGPTVDGLKVGVIGWGRQIAAFCMELLTWTEEITLLTHGKEPDLPNKARAALAHYGIPVRTEVVESIAGEGERLTHAVLMGGERLPFEAMFFHIAYGPGSSLPAGLGCEASDGGVLEVDENFQTTVPGVYAAGDITPGSKLAIRAASDGARAALGIHHSLYPPERRV